MTVTKKQSKTANPRSRREKLITINIDGAVEKYPPLTAAARMVNAFGDEAMTISIMGPSGAFEQYWDEVERLLDRNDLAAVLARRKANPSLKLPTEPTLAELHADDILSEAIRITDDSVKNFGYCVVIPHKGGVGQWKTIKFYKKRAAAEAYVEGYRHLGYDGKRVNQ
jgi:hypothetical protein